MNKADLEYIFKKQLGREPKLYFMLVDGNHKEVMRHPADKLEELIPMLDSFTYGGLEVMPRFFK
jgi:hypothetical protein